MAIAKKCDRCGIYYDEYNTKNDKEKINTIMFINVDSYNKYFSHGHHDLCPSCSTELIDWFKRRTKDDD